MDSGEGDVFSVSAASSPPNCLDIIGICELEGFLFTLCMPLKMFFGVGATVSLLVKPKDYWLTFFVPNIWEGLTKTISWTTPGMYWEALASPQEQLTPQQRCQSSCCELGFLSPSRHLLEF